MWSSAQVGEKQCLLVPQICFFTNQKLGVTCDPLCITLIGLKLLFCSLAALVTAYASAENQGDGLAFAEAIAAGLVSKDEGVPSVFASATAKILKKEGCKQTKPLLAGMFESCARENFAFVYQDQGLCRNLNDLSLFKLILDSGLLPANISKSCPEFITL